MNNQQGTMGQSDNVLCKKQDIFRVLQIAVSKSDLSTHVPMRVKISKQCSNNILLKFINFNSFLYLFPFQLCWDSAKDIYVVQTSNARQVRTLRILLIMRRLLISQKFKPLPKTFITCSGH